MITDRLFGYTSKGEEVRAYTLKKGNMSAEILTLGCVVRSLTVNDKNGVPTDVVLGYDDVESYELGTTYFGVFVGRYANRLLASRFAIDGKEYRLTPNDGKNHLHGTYTTRIFNAEVQGEELILTLSSPDGEEGFPGTLEVCVKYSLTDQGGLRMEYTAKTDKPTVVNFTNHSYFNLNGGTGDILSHTVWLDADSFTEGNLDTCPTGRILPVKDTPLDFTTEKPVGRDITAKACHVDTYRGYDHNFCIPGDITRPCARVKSPDSGIAMEVYTTQPGVQLYTGNFIAEGEYHSGKGVVYGKHSGLCLETQHYPCSPAFDNFPSTLLRPGEEYRQVTEYRFSAE